MQALDKDLIEYWGLPVSGGIIIGNVVEGSPARSAGIRQGDILTRFGGEEIRITDNSQLGDFRKRVERMAAGEEVAAQIYRDGKPVDITIQLGDAPTSAALAEDYEDDDFGLTVRELTMDVRQAMNLERDLQGVFIEGTEDSGWADVAGLYPQDIILAINGVRVASVADVRDAIEDIKHRRDPEAIFFVMRPPDTLFLRVRTEFRATRSTVVDGQ
jgi:S1-C subfamily serine protease